LSGWQGASEEIRVDLLRAFCNAIRPSSLYSNFATIGFLGWLIWDELPHLQVISWSVMVVLGGVSVRLYTQRAKTDPEFFSEPMRRVRDLLIISFVYGLIWGSAPLLFYADAPPVGRAIILFFLAFFVTMGPYAPMPGFVFVKMIGPAAGALIAVFIDGDMIVFIAVAILTLWLFLRTDVIRSYHRILRGQYELQVQLLAQQAEIERAHAAKADFLAVMSHEIRTPMNGILGMIYLIERMGLKGKMATYAAHLRSASGHLAGLLNDILDFSRLEDGNVETDRTPFGMAELTRDVIEINKPEADRKGLSLTWTLAPESDRVWIGDPRLLRQLLINILGNAVKFTETGGVILEVTAVAIDKGDFNIVFKTRDTGQGVEKERLSSIFDPFIQADASVTREHGGTGLGLAISKRIVDTMGGRIHMDSTPDLGSVVSIELPLTLASESESLKLITEPLPGELPPSRLLLVDDSEFNRMVIREVLADTACRVDEAVSGVEALEKFEPGNYDAVLTDIRMPEMDGITFVKAVRQRESEAGASPIPIIALTAAAFQDDRDAALAAGCTAYLAKPVPIPQLLRTLRDNLGGSDDSMTDTTGPVSLDRLMPRLHQQMAGDLLDIRNALADGDTGSLKRIIHAARGHSGLFGLTDIDHVLAEMEKAATGDDFQAIESETFRFESLLNELDRDSERADELGEV